MKALSVLIKRNVKLFFKDKGVFFTSLITPVILLVLYVTFLAKVYRDSFSSALPMGITLSDELLNGLVGSQLLSSLLAVSCVTVAFCANMLMVNDKVTGARKDLGMTPLRNETLAISYYVATLISTLLVALVAVVGGCVYLRIVGWYLSVTDILLLLLDVLLVVMMGTALSSLINHFLSSQGQISAVGTIVSSGYGFICGAYMPISNFGEGLQKVLSFLPSTYATSLIRNHATRGAFAAMEEEGLPEELIQEFRNVVDCRIEVFEKVVPVWAMYLILCASILVLLGAYVVLCMRMKGRRRA